MNYIIAIFMSRSETLSFANLLKRSGKFVSVVQTPRQAGRTCGISVKFLYEDFSYAKDLLSKMRPASFYGFFIDEGMNSGYKIIK